jgi:RimJ/RimL family protein N-acetyltransferase
MSSIEQFLTGEHVYLRPPCIETDVMSGSWHSWFNDDQVTKYLVHGVYPITRIQQAEFVRSAMNDPKTLLLSIIDSKNDQHVGVISLKSIDLLNRNAEIGIVMGRNPLPGAALEAMSLLVEHGFSRLNLHRIYAGQHEGLWKWINQLALIGFDLEGYRKDAGFRNGEYYGSVLTAVLAPHFFALKALRGGKVLGPSLAELLRSRRTENHVEILKKTIEIAAQASR